MPIDEFYGNGSGSLCTFPTSMSFVAMSGHLGEICQDPSVPG